MRFNRIDLNQLVCLDALLAERNVSRAAERVFLSQSAMSWSLARLREYFGDKLLISVGRGMVLTPFARSLIEPVRDILLKAQAVTSRRPEPDIAEIERHLQLVASDYVATVFLAEAFRRAEREAPGLSFELRPVSEYLTEMLDRGEVEFVIASHLAANERHPSETLFEDDYCAIVDKDHPDVGMALTLEQYQSLGHVATQWGGGHIQTLDQMAMLDQKLDRRNEVMVPNFTMMPGFVVGTRRVATLQRRLAERLATQWPVRIVQLPIHVPPMIGIMQWHRYMDDDPALVWFRKLLRNVSADLLE